MVVRLIKNPMTLTILAVLVLPFIALAGPKDEAMSGKRMGLKSQQLSFCFEEYARLVPRSKVRIEDDSPYWIRISQKVGENVFFAEGELESSRTLTLSFRLRTGDGGRSDIRGRQAYDRIIQHFGADNIKRIAGVWVKPITDVPSDNYEAFRSALAAGYSPEQAAKQTWSYRMAASHGFTAVRFVDKESMGAGVDDDILVYFERPGKKSTLLEVYEQLKNDTEF